jgi:maltooligosyltrehalose trehalohydrolase
MVARAATPCRTALPDAPGKTYSSEEAAGVTTFRVWAPEATQLDLLLGARRRPMQPQDGGWWMLDVPEAGPGTDYAFAIDGGPPRPDPRSRWQPAGVHGPSRVVDPAAFGWTDRGWQPPPLASALIYEAHVGTFTEAGTFDAAIDRLDHLASLGVTHLELMPVAACPGTRGWGYDGVDLYAPHQAYGGPDGLRRLIDACHGRGLAALLDVVYNHLGPSGNYLAPFGPYFTDRYRTPWGEAVNLDGAGSDEVRRFICDNARMWLEEYHLDGLRIDAVHAMLDRSAVHVLEELAEATRGLAAHLGRPLVLIAESDLNDPRLVRPPAVGGYGLDAQWNEDFHDARHAALTGERSGYYADFGTLADLAATLRQGFAYGGRYSGYRRRRHGRPATGVSLSGHQLVGCLQNHDQVGNRARGDRLAHLVSPGRQRVGAALAATPFLYFTDHHDPDLARAVSLGRRREFAAFGWDPEDVPDPQAPETFLRSKLDWSEPAREPHASLLAWHRRLVRLRRVYPELTDGRLDRVRVDFDEAGRWLAMSRGCITLVLNLASETRQVPLAAGRPRHLLLASSADVTVAADAIDLPSDSVAVLGPDP